MRVECCGMWGAWAYRAQNALLFRQVDLTTIFPIVETRQIQPRREHHANTQLVQHQLQRCRGAKSAQCIISDQALGFPRDRVRSSAAPSAWSPGSSLAHRRLWLSHLVLQ